MVAENFYTVEQAADTLDLTPGRIRQMLRAGDLEGSKEPGDRGWRITRESVEEIRKRRPRHSEANTASSRERAELVEELRRQNEYLREQLDAERRANDENRRLLLRALERIPPQLEAPAESEERESDISENPTHTPTEAAAGPETKTSKPERTFWQRLIGR